MKLIKQYLLYLVRWQLSTPILAIVMSWFAPQSEIQWIPSIVANLIGGLIFFWVDKFIFRDKKSSKDK
jgi:bacteriorhodopsin